MPIALGSCTVLVAARAGSRPPLVSHTFDTAGGIDFRLCRVPPNPKPPSPRPVFHWDEEAVPRFFGVGRGPIPAYASLWKGSDEPTVVGYIPQTKDPRGTHGYWEAASGIANDAGLMIAESTCSAIFGAELRGVGDGKALLGYMELTRIALERCSGAREAIKLMGSLAEEFGFAGNTKDLGGSAESLAVVDKEEAWVMHVMSDDTGESAIWAAQRLAEGHAAVIPNIFVIREVDLEENADEFLLSSSATAIAQRLGLWTPGEPFDFAGLFSMGEARKRFYCGRRLWRALTLFTPSLDLSPEYGDLIKDCPFPFSVVPDAPLSRHDLIRIMRDTYVGTPYDLSMQPAAGPFGQTDRYDGFDSPCRPSPSSEQTTGAFERPIAIYRMAYSYVGEPSVEGTHLFHFAPHASQTSIYFPILCSMAECPAPLATGSVREIDRSVAYWAFRIAKHTCRGLPWDRCLKVIQERQQLWEGRASQLLETADADDDRDGEATADALNVLAREVVEDWWTMLDELLLRYGDGWEHEFDQVTGAKTSKPIAYPTPWLERVGFFD